MLFSEEIMQKDTKSHSHSAFDACGFRATLALLMEQIRNVYLSDQYPWIIGYSGGKDSTATLELVWNALLSLEPEKRKKPVHIISTDTLVENPIVALWVSKSLEQMKVAADRDGLPIYPNRLTPEIRNSFWVNLIGRGYPAPRPRFRWCTERLKIEPSNRFIRKILGDSGEAILVLGTRKAESSARAHVMNKLEEKRVRDLLSPNASMPNCYVYSPIQDWTNEDVWLFLLEKPFYLTPWGINNNELFQMYKGASPDHECPIQFETGAPSCGGSRFGCWVCTMVTSDKSLQAMVQNDHEKEWMLPLLGLRNKLGRKDDRDLRDFRRMKGTVQLFNDRPVPGPYKQQVREEILRWLLKAQNLVREKGPVEVSNIELITFEELNEIRRIWVIEKHEIEDNLPRIYEEFTGKLFPGQSLDDSLIFGEEEMRLLRQACNDAELHFQLTRDLLEIERRYRTMARRTGLFQALRKGIEKNFYDDEIDAIDRALRFQEAREKARQGDLVQLNLFKASELGTAKHN